VIHFLIVGALALALAMLVRAKLIQVDLFFPWFAAVLILGFASTRPGFVDWLALRLGILYPPIAVVFLVIFLLVGVVITLTISVTRLRARQAAMAQHMAALELDLQERIRGSAETGQSSDAPKPQ
jgi:hypothetical protein